MKPFSRSTNIALLLAGGGIVLIIAGFFYAASNIDDYNDHSHFFLAPHMVEIGLLLFPISLVVVKKYLLAGILTILLIVGGVYLYLNTVS